VKVEPTCRSDDNLTSSCPSRGHRANGRGAHAPAHPGLAWLRKAAKDLLTELRAAERDTLFHAHRRVTPHAGPNLRIAC